MGSGPEAGGGRWGVVVEPAPCSPIVSPATEPKDTGMPSAGGHASAGADILTQRPPCQRLENHPHPAGSGVAGTAIVTADPSSQHNFAKVARMARSAIWPTSQILRRLYGRCSPSALCPASKARCLRREWSQSSWRRGFSGARCEFRAGGTFSGSVSCRKPAFMTSPERLGRESRRGSFAGGNVGAGTSNGPQR